MSIPRLALRNAAANRARSLLVVGLLASASFILVAVAANRRDVPESAIVSRDGGAGGFSLRATTALPLRYDISTTLGRQNLGFSDADRQLLAGATIVPFMAVAGDDISCRSLARPVRPTLLGASQAMIARGGFSVRLAAGLNDPNPWTALLADDPDGAIPVFGDSDSVQWILHGRPGGVLNISGPNDTPLKLRIVGVIPGSVFAGELIMSEQHLRRIYGESAGQSYFFIDAPRDRLDEVARMLRRRLDDFGIEVQLTRRIIAGFVAVQNLYLSIFLMLGGLGMLLGAAGMLTVILRNVLERRKEMALMLACGFSRRRLIAVVAMEHAGLLMAGLACGTVAAAIAVAPTVLGSQSNVNWSMLTALLASITVIGMLGCVIGAIGAVRSNLVAALRQE